MPTPYIDILLQTALVASIIPLGSEAGLYAMKSFGNFPMDNAVVVATIGATLGHIFNLFTGLLFYRLASRGPKGISQEKYATIQGYFHKYGIFLLLFCWIPVGNFLVVAAGFFKTPPKIALPLIIIGVATQYAVDLL